MHARYPLASSPCSEDKVCASAARPSAPPHSSLRRRPPLQAPRRPLETGEASDMLPSASESVCAYSENCGASEPTGEVNPMLWSSSDEAEGPRRTCDRGPGVSMPSPCRGNAGRRGFGDGKRSSWPGRSLHRAYERLRSAPAAVTPLAVAAASASARCRTPSAQALRHAGTRPLLKGIVRALSSMTAPSAVSVSVDAGCATSHSRR